jgi:predicted nucleotidyltransferase
MVNKEAIQKVAREIVGRFHPRKVILFGSHAYGRPTEDSDVDLLVIMETEERNLPQALKISRAISHPFPMDLLVLKPREVQTRLQGGDLVLREILTKGEVLFEASDTGVD